jgi:ATP synthase protein I
MPPSKTKSLGDLLSIGIMFPACVAIGYGIGYWIDRWAGTNGFKLGGILFGIAAGFINVFRIAKEFSDRSDDES